MVRLIQTSFAVIPLIPSTDPARLRALPIHPAAEPQDSSGMQTLLCPSHLVTFLSSSPFHHPQLTLIPQRSGTNPD